MNARTSMLYSDPGGTKTTQLYFLAKWLWEKYGLRSRLVEFDIKYEQFKGKQADGKSLLDSGVVELYDASNMKTALADVRRLSEGYWPLYNVKDKSGNLIEKYFRSDKNCETKDWDKIGAYLIDGLHCLCDSWLVHVSNQQGGVGGKPAWDHEEDGYEFHGVSDTHYGVVQKELIQIVKKGFSQLPVRYVVYTSAVEKGIESYRRKRGKRKLGNNEEPVENPVTMYGPKAAGQALTPFMPGWFADCFHLASIQTEKHGDVRVAHYEDYPHEETGAPFKCRVDILPEQVPLLRAHKGWLPGMIPLGFTSGIEKFYAWLEEQNG